MPMGTYKSNRKSTCDILPLRPISSNDYYVLDFAVVGGVNPKQQQQQQ
jgi:hypothetical protein